MWCSGFQKTSSLLATVTRKTHGHHFVIIRHSRLQFYSVSKKCSPYIFGYSTSLYYSNNFYLSILHNISIRIFTLIKNIHSANTENFKLTHCPNNFIHPSPKIRHHSKRQRTPPAGTSRKKPIIIISQH